MTSELFTLTGERKYLTEAEREAFMAAAIAHERGEVRTFGLVLAYTGCRISEALELTPRRIGVLCETPPKVPIRAFSKTLHFDNDIDCGFNLLQNNGLAFSKSILKMIFSQTHARDGFRESVRRV